MKDRVPTYPGRVTLTPVPGQTNTYDMVRADEPTEPGMPLNKANLLSDTTASALGLDPENDPTVNEAFAALPTKQYVDASAQYVKLKDITTTANATQINVDVSDIGWSEYAYVDIYAKLSKAASATQPYLAMFFNSLATSDYYRMKNFGSSASSGMIFALCWQKSASTVDHTGYLNVRLYPGGGRMWGQYSYPYYNGSNQDMNAGLAATEAASGLTGTNVTAINFAGYTGGALSGETLIAGCEIKIYGVKK